MVLSPFEDVVRSVRKQSFEAQKLAENLRTTNEALFGTEFFTIISKCQSKLEAIHRFCDEWLKLYNNESILVVIEVAEFSDKELSQFIAEKTFHLLKDPKPRFPKSIDEMKKLLLEHKERHKKANGCELCDNLDSLSKPTDIAITADEDDWFRKSLTEDLDSFHFDPKRIWLAASRIDASEFKYFDSNNKVRKDGNTFCGDKQEFFEQLRKKSLSAYLTIARAARNLQMCAFAVAIENKIIEICLDQTNNSDDKRVLKSEMFFRLFVHVETLELVKKTLDILRKCENRNSLGEKDLHCLVPLAEAARQLEWTRQAARVEKAILTFCLDENAANSEIRHEMLSRLIEMFKRQEVPKKEEEIFAAYMDNPIIKEYRKVYYPRPSSESSPEKTEFQGAYSVPALNCCYFVRGIEQDILNKIEEVAQNPYQGALAIKAGAGVGKSTTMANLLNDKRYWPFFGEVCGFHKALWLNCYGWLDESNFENFTTKLSEVAVGAGFKNLADLTKEKHVFFVLDDMYNPNLLLYFREQLPHAVCCILTSDIWSIYKKETTLATDWPPLVNTLYEMPELNDSQVLEMLEITYDLKSKLNTKMLQKLKKKICNFGKLPLFVQVAARGFKFFRDGEEIETEFEKVMKDLLTDEEQIKPIRERFEFSMRRVASDIVSLKQYFAFLFFNAGEKVSSEDLAFLWGLKKDGALKVVSAICIVFEKQSLVVKVDHAFIVHKMLHKVAERHAKKTQFASSLHNLRFKIIESGCFDQPLEDKNQFFLQRMEAVRRGRMESVNTEQYEEDILTKAVITAARRGQTSILRKILQNFEKLMKDQRVSAAIISAAANGHLDVVKFIVQKFPHAVHQATKDDKTVITMAAEKGYLKIVEFIADQDQTTVSPAKEGAKTAIMAAAENGQLDVVEFIVGRFPNTISQATSNGWTAMMFAAHNGHLKVVEFIDKKDPTARGQLTYDGKTVEGLASENMQNHIAEYLKRNSAGKALVQ